ncbi:hypothetical protein VSS74_31490, partial [Conexibacter stalactiti]
RPTVELRTARVEASGDGVVNVVLGCAAVSGARCRGSLALTTATRQPARLLAGGRGRGWRSAGARVGGGSYSIAAGRLSALRLKLSSGAQRVLAARGTLALSARATQASGAAPAVRAVRVLATRAPALRIDGGDVTADADGRVALRVRCGEPWARCAGTVTLAGIRDGRALGSARVTVAGGPVHTVAVRLNVSGRRALAEAGRLRLRVLAVTSEPAARPTRSQRELTVVEERL